VVSVQEQPIGAGVPAKPWLQAWAMVPGATQKGPAGIGGYTHRPSTEGKDTLEERQGYVFPFVHGAAGEETEETPRQPSRARNMAPWTLKGTVRKACFFSAASTQGGKR
jgi:hypothetical protein